MELLRKKDFDVEGNKCTMELFKRYNNLEVRTKIPKDMNIGDNLVFENFEECIVKLCTNIDLKIISLPETYELVKSEGFLDAYYPIGRMLDGDECYITDDNEIGKNLIHVEMDKKEESAYIFNISFDTLVVKSNGVLGSLFDINESAVSKFLKSEIISVMQ